MSDSSHISWTQSTWNPILGCQKESPGCANCYAVKEVYRMASNPNPKISSVNSGLVHKLGNGKLDWTGEITTVPDRLNTPLKWKKPRRIFVNSLSDLFHPKVPDLFIDAVFATMAIANQHTYQILTKHPDRMAEYFNDPAERQNAIGNAAIDHFDQMLTGDPECMNDEDFIYAPFPLPNVWLGTSVENQEYTDKRLPWLEQVPAVIRFVSAEPLLGPIDINEYWPNVDWVIVGGESGANARAMDPQWVRGLRDQCKARGVAFYFKQWGEFSPNVLGINDTFPPARIGKKEAGRNLDGDEWNEFPEVK